MLACSFSENGKKCVILLIGHLDCVITHIYKPCITSPKYQPYPLVRMWQKNNSTVTSLCEAGDLALQDLTSLVNINMTGLKVEESAECDITAFLGDCLHTHPARTPISQPAAQLSCDQLINNHSSTPVALPYHFPDLNTCSMTSLVRSQELA